MRFTAALFALAASFSAASANKWMRQSFPSCADNCIGGASTGTCSAIDELCLCSSSAFIDSVESCIEESCAASDIQASLEAAEAVCAQAGVTLSLAGGLASQTESDSSATTSASSSSRSATVYSASPSSASVASSASAPEGPAATSGESAATSGVSAASPASSSGRSAASSAAAPGSARATAATASSSAVSSGSNTEPPPSSSAPTTMSTTSGASSLAVDGLMGLAAVGAALFAML